MAGLAGVSSLCSFSFGWTIGLPISIVILVGVFYSFSGLGGFTHLVSHADGIGERILYGRSFQTSFLIGIRGWSHIAGSAWCSSGLDQPGCYGKRGIFQLGPGLQRFGHRRVGCLACIDLLRSDAKEPSLCSFPKHVES